MRAFYNKAEVSEITSLSDTTLWRAVKDSKFPAPVRISKRRVAWPREVIDAWVAEKSRETQMAA